MDKFSFIEYTAKRYGIDISIAETLVDMFSDTLQELLTAGIDVDIDEIGQFESMPLLPKNFNHRNNIILAKAKQQQIVSFTPSNKLANRAIAS